MIVLPPGKSQIVEQLYEGHLGVSCMKNLARSFVQWPNIDSDLEERVKGNLRVARKQNTSHPHNLGNGRHSDWSSTIRIVDGMLNQIKTRLGSSKSTQQRYLRNSTTKQHTETNMLDSHSMG